ncbi:MAG: MBL fold metallo-hydrolase [Chloroflexota bacterium]
MADAQDTFPLFSPVKYGQPVAVGQGIEASFHDAGHVLGSSMVRLRIDQASGPRTIIFSGDVGRWDRPILHDPKVFSQTDYVIVESTYGDRVHDPGDISDRLAEVVNAAYRAGGNIIVPSFALERTQEVLYYMNDLLMDNRIPHLLVFLDSPMAISITEVFKRHSELFDQDMTRLLKHHHSPFEFHGLKMVETVDESKSLNHITGTIMIIAGSGMCTGGRVKHHLVNNISRPESTILFVGYQASGTPGRQIVDGAEQVRLLGQSYPVRASIAQLNGFSSHADKNELLRWLSGLTAAPKHVFVTHGEAGSAEQFRQFLSAQTGWAVSVPEYGSAVSLE